MQQLDRAIRLALKVHEAQIDKVGRPYFEHCQRLALTLSGDEAKTVAYLHDVIEKGNGWTLDRLRDRGFSATVLEAVEAMTRRKDEEEDAFVRRAASNPLALPVKIADLKDNLWQAQQAGTDPAMYQYGLAVLFGKANS